MLHYKGWLLTILRSLLEATFIGATLAPRGLPQILTNTDWDFFFYDLRSQILKSEHLYCEQFVLKDMFWSSLIQTFISGFSSFKLTLISKFVWVLLQYCPKIKVFQVLQMFSSKTPHEGYLIIMTLLFLESNFNQPVITSTSSTSCTVIEYWSEVCRRSLWPPLMLLMYFQTSLCLYFSTPNVYFPEEKTISSMVRVLLKIQNPNCVCRSTSYVPLDRVFSNIIILPRCNVNGSSQTSLFS